MNSVSVVIPTFNNLPLTIKCYESLLRAAIPTVPSEIIFVDNGSTDGTVGWIKEIGEKTKGVKGVLLPENTGFAGACNRGFSVAGGDIITFLNNDTKVSPNFFSDIVHLVNKYPEMGIGGVSSGFAGGIQQIPADYTGDQGFIDFAEKVRKKWGDDAVNAGTVVGICIFGRRSFWESLVGFYVPEGQLFDEGFFPGMWEDNDICFRSYLKGFLNYVFMGFFVHHEGSQTFRNLEDTGTPSGILQKNKLVYESKWKSILYRPRSEHKIVAMLRVRNGILHIRRCLSGLEKWVDEIVILDTGSTDGTVECFDDYKKVALVDTETFKNKPLQEYDERQYLLEMAQRRNPTWIARVDVDEVWEDKITDWLPRLLNPIDPAITHWRFPMKNFWRGEDKVRTDGVWGDMAVYGMFRNVPTHKLTNNEHPQGFHIPAIPSPPFLWTRVVPVSMLHYGYSRWDEVKRKAKWYQQIDTDKRLGSIGTPNYEHLTDESHMSLVEYTGPTKLTVLMMIKDEWQLAKHSLESVSLLADEIIFVYTGEGKFDPDRVLDDYYGIAKIIPFEWCDDYSKPRNKGLEKIKEGWVLHLDPDERVTPQSTETLSRLLGRVDADVFLVSIVNSIVDSQTKERRDSVQEVPRLFRADRGLRYSNPVHETLDDAIKGGDNIIVRKGDVYIEHYGFILDIPSLSPVRMEWAGESRLSRKLKYYKKLNQVWARKSPCDPRPYYNLGMQYLDEGDIEKGINELRRAESLNEMGLWQASASLTGVYIGLAKEHLSTALKQLSKESINRKPMEELYGILNQHAKSIVRVG